MEIDDDKFMELRHAAECEACGALMAAVEAISFCGNCGALISKRKRSSAPAGWLNDRDVEKILDALRHSHFQRLREATFSPN